MGTSPKKELMEPKQTEHVDAEVAKLLAFAPDLLELYKKFRPLMNNVSSSGEKLFTNAKGKLYSAEFILVLKLEMETLDICLFGP